MKRAYQYKDDYEEYRDSRNRLPGSILYMDVCRKVVYSLESFIKVSRDMF